MKPKGDMPVYILFLLQLNHVHGGFKALSGSQSMGNCIHIDELREPKKSQPSLINYAGTSISSLFDFEQAKHRKLEILEIVKGCVQSALKELNDLKSMSNDEISEKIKVLQELIDDKEGKKYM